MQFLLHWHRFSLLLTFLLGLSLSAPAQKKPLPGYVVTAGGDTLRGAIVPASRLTQQYRVEFIPMQGHQRLFLDGYQLASYTYYTDLDTIRYVSLLFAQRGIDKPCRGFLQQVVAGKAQLYYYSFHNSGQQMTSFNSGGLLSTSPSNSTASRQVSAYAHSLMNSTSLTSSIKPQKNAKYPTFGPLSKRGVYNPDNTLVIYRADKSRLEDVNEWRFPKDAAVYFADFPDLVADLQSGQYRARDLPQIVRRYNAWHLTRKSAP
ncbi:hypothetical protein [Hymenobacter radiodurans]|uniref:hypothetical protein n=1 Tax=Hymenobacter radiodurans TaxID=2496028 RepID=UPI0010585A39|nr:hypothetical protein [Hymenobacter radiodurans]